MYKLQKIHIYDKCCQTTSVARCDLFCGFLRIFVAADKNNNPERNFFQNKNCISTIAHRGMGGGGTHSYSINLNLNGQTLGGQRWIPFLVQIQDMDLNDHLAKKSSLNSIPTGSNSKNTVA